MILLGKLPQSVPIIRKLAYNLYPMQPKHMIAFLLLFMGNYCYAQAIPEHPLQDFLKAPVTRIEITATSEGCFHYMKDHISYKAANGGEYLTVDTINVTPERDKNGMPEKQAPFNNRIDEKELSGILSAIDKEPGAIPSIKDFDIDSEERSRFAEYIKGPLYSEAGEERQMSAEWKSFHTNLLSGLDTLQAGTIKCFLDRETVNISTTTDEYTIRITNSRNDVVTIHKEYDGVISPPWLLAWEITYKKQKFTCYSIALSRYIKNCLPDTFMDKTTFTNKNILKYLADYLYQNKA
jgi:hypothetical protein